MKKLLIALCLTCTLALTATAGEKGKKKHERTAEQKDLIAKYDTDKDGKLSKEEKAKVSGEDKEKLQKAFPGHKKAGEAKTETK